MKVKCVNLGGAALLAADIASGNTRRSVFHVTPGREYTVYGVLFRKAVLSYLIQADTGFPQWTSASLFQVVCGRVSRFWVYVDWSSDEVEYLAVMTFPEFVQSYDIYNQLALGDDSAREMFYKLQRSADLEFLDASVEKTAEAPGENWLQCPLCGDAWESETPDAMVRCPKCQSVLRNPKHKPVGPR